MINAEPLLNKIKNSPEIIEFKRIESILKENNLYSLRIKKLHNLQKQIVKVSTDGNSIEKLKIDYDELYTSLVENPMIEEYLELKSRINSILIDIQDIFYNEL